MVTLLVVLSIASVVIVYAVFSAPFPVKPGVKVGDTFTYSIVGRADLSENATLKPDFLDYNKTQSYDVTVTGVNGTRVSLFVSWNFNNGTNRESNQTIDLATGARTDGNGFWFIFSSGLSVGDSLRPLASGYENTVNMTETWNYTSSSRPTDFFQMGGEQSDSSTNTTWNDYILAFFDKQTGMITTLNHFEVYFYPNSEYPQATLVTTYRLTQTNVWPI